MTRVFFALPGNEEIARSLAARNGNELGTAEYRRFPDEESYVRFDTQVSGKPVVLVCTLDRPDAKLLPLLFSARLARELGAKSVGLVAPYLAYMRQDRRFKTGEAVTSKNFAQLLSNAVDWLITVDPHLHRVHRLEDIYSVPARVLHASPLIAEWIRREVGAPLLVGPDSESAQWVEAVAGASDAPHVVLEKIRRSDRDVEVSVPDVAKWQGRTPVLVDDIISTARTMIETAAVLRRAGLLPPVCIGVHAVFAAGAYDALLATGARVVTANTIAHTSNAIDVSGLIAGALKSMA
jgi:ribose-phosphate pyrophosphokinase